MTKDGTVQKAADLDDIDDIDMQDVGGDKQDEEAVSSLLRLLSE